MIAPADVLEVIDAVPLWDEGCFRARQAFARGLGVDEATLEAQVGFLAAMPVGFSGGRFDLEIQGVDAELAIVIGALDERERFGDLVAWPIDRPSALASYNGAAMLGAHNLRRLSGSPLAAPLRVHRTAASWLRAGAVGIVPIDLRRTARMLIEFDGLIQAEDDRHGAELAAAMAAFVNPARIVVAEMEAA